MQGPSCRHASKVEYDLCSGGHNDVLAAPSVDCQLQLCTCASVQQTGYLYSVKQQLGCAARCNCQHKVMVLLVAAELCCPQHHMCIPGVFDESFGIPIQQVPYC